MLFCYLWLSLYTVFKYCISSKTPILVFRRAKTHFAFFGDLFAFFNHNRDYSHPFHRNESKTNGRKIIKSSSKIANFIFFYEKRDFGG